MNELQQVLIVFAIIVIVGLYLLQKRKNKSATIEKTPKPSESEASESPSSQIKTNAGAALNELGEAHIPVSEETNHRLHIEEEVPENQLGLSFGEGFEPPKSEPEPVIEEVKTAKHIVIEAEDITPVEGFVPETSTPDMPSFGVPKKPSTTAEEISQQKDNVEKTEPQVFVLIVMGTEEFLWPKVNQTLQGVGLSPSENNIFVKKDSMGNEIIRVANLLEPGTFPLDQPTNNEFKTPGVVLILELPTTVKAPAVMHDMIMMARKISQRLNGRLYNGERHLIKESDLQQMRDEAVAYESKAI